MDVVSEGATERIACESRNGVSLRLRMVRRVIQQDESAPDRLRARAQIVRDVRGWA